MSDVRLATSDAEIRRCAGVMQQLRPAIGADEFLTRAKRQQAGEKWRLAYLEEGGEVVAVSGFRILDCMATGKTLYVDDLVTAEDRRSKGHGEKMLGWIEQKAREEGCAVLRLDSGTHRTGAHKFYFRMGMPIVSFHFMKTL